LTSTFNNNKHEVKSFIFASPTELAIIIGKKEIVFLNAATLILQFHMSIMLAQFSRIMWILPIVSIA
jgi:hypothetical protein